jgi:anaphase-promoting complex subunit 10
LKREKQQELGDLAVWSVSSAKPGFGVDQLRDDNLNTYWQYVY